jgi:hypothetical protein
MKHKERNFRCGKPPDILSTKAHLPKTATSGAAFVSYDVKEIKICTKMGQHAS